VATVDLEPGFGPAKEIDQDPSGRQRVVLRSVDELERLEARQLAKDAAAAGTPQKRFFRPSTGKF
jgi:ribosomal protein L32E